MLDAITLEGSYGVDHSLLLFCAHVGGHGIKRLQQNWYTTTRQHEYIPRHEQIWIISNMLLQGTKHQGSKEEGDDDAGIREQRNGFAAEAIRHGAKWKRRDES